MQNQKTRFRLNQQMKMVSEGDKITQKRKKAE